jgi:hypothetical protein
MFAKILGASWKTSLAGYAALLVTAAQQVFVEQGWPKTGSEWTAFCGKLILAMGLLSAKDGNVTNSPVPLDHAIKVEDANGKL